MLIPTGHVCLPRLCTGNWGCGQYGNNHAVVFVLQVLAARLAGITVGVCRAEYTPAEAARHLGSSSIRDLVLPT
jgi:hypothetical protein